MTKRDDYYKTMGRVSTLIGVTKNLGSLPSISGDPALTSLATTAGQCLSELYTKLSEKGFGASNPTSKVLVMPPMGSKEEFALSAMAEAMGLRVVDAELLESKPLAQPSLKTGLAALSPKQVQSLEAAAEAAKAVLPIPTEAETFVKHVVDEIDAMEKGKVPPLGSIEALEAEIAAGGGTIQPPNSPPVVISKKTGKPKRSYVKSGKFSAENLKKVGGSTYRARRMS